MKNKHFFKPLALLLALALPLLLSGCGRQPRTTASASTRPVSETSSPEEIAAEVSRQIALWEEGSRREALRLQESEAERARAESERASRASEERRQSSIAESSSRAALETIAGVGAAPWEGEALQALRDSDAYLKEPLLEETLAYFEKVTLNSEFNGSIPISKWTGPITISLEGQPDETDREVVGSIVDILSQIEGMPEISLVEQGGAVRIFMVPLAEFPDLFTQYHEGNWGYFETFWDNNHINRSRIAVATDVTGREDRTHLIWEELVQSVGLLNDSYDYPDSIFQQEYTYVQHPAPIDFALIRMLYNPGLSPGMGAAEALSRLRELY